MKKLIVVMLLLSLVALSTFSQAASPPADKAYVPLTRAEAETWLKSITMDQLIDFVIKYDEVEHSKPVFGSFDYVCVVSGLSVSVIPTNPTTDVKLATLGYKVQLPTMTFKDVIPKPQTHFWTGVGIGGAAGVIVTGVIVAIVAGVVK